ncbi:FAD binding domain-containing protein [Fomitopsis serialis]|uniref:FAD binding domain-containing protein n=1 Tax=Fomitopsis serialis TaxID=139415 RepID=UPI002007DFBB|nr:FAD binding domain-containing protein [Neoantrodia serialis]KAH9918655.1 FAD binding domain-containing protein [Neoantrodia serialis]
MYSPAPTAMDVLVVGGGPTALVATYMLLKAGVVALAVEQYDKAAQASYGRACMLYSRSVELLDLIGMYARIADIGFLVKETITFKDGKEVPARGWSFVRDAIAGNTFFEFSFSVRQKYLEAALREAIQYIDPTALRAPAKLIDYSIDPTAPYPVLATIQEDQRTYQVRCRYLVGADGGRSTVRSICRIPFPGTNSNHRWVRMDAVVRTDMPHSRRGGVAIESIEHGNVLWTPIDNGRTRIGFVCPQHLFGQNGESPTAEVIMAEAKKAVRPFTLDFVELDWWTVYAIGQRVAETFKDGPVLLAGDAAHTHSSGAAQLDRDIASLISGKIPSHFRAPPDADVNSYLDEVFTTNASFTVGLGISYTENVLNRRAGASATPAAALLGRRAPDVALVLPGAAFPRRLYELMPYSGRFWILQALDAPDAFTRTRAPVFAFLTIPRGEGALQSAETLGEQPLGISAYDVTGDAYAKYAVMRRRVAWSSFARTA